MSRLPIPGSDDNTWGSILNDFLSQAHNANGSLQSGAVSNAGAEMNVNKGIPSGYAGLGANSLVATVNLGTGTPSSTTFLRGDQTWATPSGGGSGSPGGSSSQVQFNAAGTFGGIAGATTDGTALILSSGDLKLAGSTSGTTILNASSTASGTLTLPATTDTIVGRATTDALSNKDLTSGTNTFPTFNQTTTGSAAKWTTARLLAGNSVDGSANVAFANKFIVQGTTDSGLSNAQFLGALGSGLLKNTTTTGVLTIATADTDYTTPTGTETLTNKRINRRTGTTTSSATPTINTDTVDFYSITALAVNITSFTTNLSGTPVEAQTLWIAITDNGTARTLAFGSSFEASTVALPTTTVISTRIDIGFIWNTVTSKWRCVAVA